MNIEPGNSSSGQPRPLQSRWKESLCSFYQGSRIPSQFWSVLSGFCLQSPGLGAGQASKQGGFSPFLPGFTDKSVQLWRVEARALMRMSRNQGHISGPPPEVEVSVISGPPRLPSTSPCCSGRSRRLSFGLFGFGSFFGCFYRNPILVFKIREKGALYDIL